VNPRICNTIFEKSKSLQSESIYTYHSRFIPDGVAEESQIFPKFYQNYLAMINFADVTGDKPIAVWSQYISCVNNINPLGAFYDIPERKREALLFYFDPDTTWDYKPDNSVNVNTKVAQIR
jgi:hypothetical protein